MRNTLYKLSLTMVLFFVSHLCLSQQFGSLKNVESFMDLTPLKLEAELAKEGYDYASKETLTKSTIKTFKKGGFIVNYSFEGEKIKSFQWNESIDRVGIIIGQMESSGDYQFVDSKTDRRFGIFYLESTKTNLDFTIFKTKAQLQKGEVLFSLIRNADRTAKK